jgi:pullulanase
MLHPILQQSVADPIARQSQYDAETGTFTIPPRTTAVFVESR